MRKTTLPLSLLCLVLSAWTSIAGPPPDPTPVVCCGDGGVEWRFQHLDKRFLNGEITEDERFRAIAAEAKGAAEGAAWVVAGFAVKLVLRGGRWILLATRSAAKTSADMTTVGRWMSRGEYAAMKNGTTIIEGAGGQTFVTKGGSHLFPSASKGSIYVEFQVPTNSLLKGGKPGWFKIIGPNASKSQQYLLRKQGGALLPPYQNLTPPLLVK